jgi:hypothetical protein
MPPQASEILWQSRITADANPKITNMTGAPGRCLPFASALPIWEIPLR